MEGLGSTYGASKVGVFAWRIGRAGLALFCAFLCADLAARKPGSGAGETDPPSGQMAQYDHEAPVWSVVFAGSTHLASSTITGEVRLRDLATGQVLRLQDGPGCSALSLAFAPGGRILAAGGNAPAVRLWDSEAGIELEPLRVGEGVVKSIVFSPDGSLLAVGAWRSEGRRSVVTLWEWPGRRRLAVLDGHRGGITVLAFWPDGSRLVAANSAGEVKLWDVTAGQERSWRLVHGADISALAFSPDGSLFATAYVGGIVRLWDAASGEPRGSLPELPIGVTALAFSPDGTTLAMARANGIASLWEVASGREAGAVRVPTGPLQSVAFSGDGRVFATGELDGSVRLWDVTLVGDGKSQGL